MGKRCLMGRVLAFGVVIYLSFGCCVRMFGRHLTAHRMVLHEVCRSLQDVVTATCFVYLASD